MSNPNRAPMASSNGNLGPQPSISVGRGDWNSAPNIVSYWAYPLTWLGIVVLPQFILASTFGLSPVDTQETGQDALAALLLSLLLVFAFCLNHGLKKGAHWAWGGQIAFSCLGLLTFPIGTAIYGFLLSQWFKPQTKAWFGQN